MTEFTISLKDSRQIPNTPYSQHGFEFSMTGSDMSEVKQTVKNEYEEFKRYLHNTEDIHRLAEKRRIMLDLLFKKNNISKEDIAKLAKHADEVLERNKK